MLVIINGEKLFGLVGVMGGVNLEIIFNMKIVFFESVNFKLENIRMIVKKVGIRLEVFLRNEKDLDFNFVEIVVNRVV